MVLAYIDLLQVGKFRGATIVAKQLFAIVVNIREQEQGREADNKLLSWL